MEEIIFLDAETVGEVPELQELQKLGKVILYPWSTPEQTLERIRTCTIVLTNKVILDRKILDAAPLLKLICITATGTNNVDVVLAQQRGIAVRNVVGYSTNSVAQMTFACLLYLMHHLPYFDDFVKTGQYSKEKTFTHLGPSFHELQGKIFGIIGLGEIGRQVAKIASAFGASVIYFSTSGRNNNQEYVHKKLDQLLAESDVISIHAPLNTTTENLINASALALVKPSAFLINMGRGGIVNEAALASALDEGRLKGAALDVLRDEPLLPGNPLLQIKHKDKLLITPHIAWSGFEARRRLIQKTVENIKEFLNISIQNV